MNILEAVEVVKTGRNVRRKSWVERVELFYSDMIVWSRYGDGSVGRYRADTSELFATDWEIVPKKVGFEEAFAAAKKGKKVRRTVWGSGTRLESTGSTLHVFDVEVLGCRPCNWNPHWEDLFAEDWVILD